MSSPESYFSSSQWTLLDQCPRLMSNWIGELKGQATGYSGYPCMLIRCILQISHPISITITCFYLHGCCLTCWIVVPFCFWFASFCILTYNHHHWLSHTLGGSCAKCDYFSQPTHVLVGLTCFLPIRYSLHPFHPWALSLNYNKFSFLTLPGSLVEAYYCHVYQGTVKSKDYSGATRIFGEKLCSDERSSNWTKEVLSHLLILSKWLFYTNNEMLTILSFGNANRCGFAYSRVWDWMAVDAWNEEVTIRSTESGDFCEWHDDVPTRKLT